MAFRTHMVSISVTIVAFLLVFGSALAQDQVPTSPSVSSSDLPEYLGNVREPGFVGSVLSTVKWYLLWNPSVGMMPLYVYDFSTVCLNHEDITGPVAIIGDMEILRTILPSTHPNLQVALDPETGTPLGATLYKDALTALGASQEHLGASCEQPSTDSSADSQARPHQEEWFIASTQPFPEAIPRRRFVADRP